MAKTTINKVKRQWTNGEKKLKYTIENALIFLKYK